MAKIIISEKQLKTIKKRISEEISPREARNHKNSLKSVVDGRRGVGFYGGASEEDIENLINTGLKYIEIGLNNAYVFYSDGNEEQATQLARIAKRNQGYLPVKNPEETYIIGILLGYNKQEVKDFVLKRFPDFKFYQ